MPKETGHRVQDYEAIISRVKDVVSARVIADESGQAQEIHVLARLRRSAKQVVRDIESVMLTTFNQTVDVRKISVAQIRDESESTLNPMRLVLEGVQVATAANSSQVRVVLRNNDQTYEGQASGPRASGTRLRLVAEATANAVTQFLGGKAGLSISDVLAVVLGGQPVVLVGAVLVDFRGRKETRLLGATFVRADDREAVARATLDSANRQLDTVAKIKSWTGGASTPEGPQPSGA